MEPTKAQMIQAILADPATKTVDWKRLMGEGVVCRVHLSRKGARFRQKLHFKDLGIHIPDKKTAETMQSIFALGMKKLLPKEYMERIDRAEYKARALLEEYSYPTIWGPFIPVTAYQNWRDEMKKVEEEYFAAQKAVLDNYEKVRAQVVREYTLAAKNAYRILHTISREALSDEEQSQEVSYLLKVRANVRNMFPAKETIAKAFSFSIDATYIDLPRLAGNDEEGGALVEKSAIEGTTESETEQLRWFQESNRQRAEMVRAMNEDILRTARKQKEEQVDRFLTTIIGQCRGLVYEATTSVLVSLKNKERLQPRSVVQLKTLVENIKNLNFYEDKDVDRATALIERMVDRPSSERSLKEIEQTLRDIATVMRASLLPLEYEFREEREGASLEERARLAIAGIPERPSTREEREARASLSLSVPEYLLIRQEREEAEIVPENPPALIPSLIRGERSW